MSENTKIGLAAVAGLDWDMLHSRCYQTNAKKTILAAGIAHEQDLSVRSESLDLTIGETDSI